jgi:hypothetical protein
VPRDWKIFTDPEAPRYDLASVRGMGRFCCPEATRFGEEVKSASMVKGVIQSFRGLLVQRRQHEASSQRVRSEIGSKVGEFSFEAFISYSHAVDGRLAAALQGGLHRFARPLFKLRAIRVFRDETTLAMTPQLWPEIEKALRRSRFFILMADPLSAQSEWVQKEAACWVAMKRTDTILIVWTGGDLV